MTYLLGICSLIFLSLSMVNGQRFCDRNHQFSTFVSDDCRKWLLCTWPGFKPRVLVKCGEGRSFNTISKECKKSYSGLSGCETQGTCGLKRNPCRNGGTCILRSEGKLKPVCMCNQGYKGQYCQIEPPLKVQCSWTPFAPIADPTECHSYFDCNGVNGRQPAKKECNYRKYQHRKYVHGSCETVYPSCEQKSDGFHPQKESKNRFMICDNERLKSVGICPDSSNGPQIATNKGCRNIFNVSPENGGWMPNCTKKRDGYYPLKKGGCHQFLICRKGKFKIGECPRGLGFRYHESKQGNRVTCKPKAEVCRPCGYKL